MNESTESIVNLLGNGLSVLINSVHGHSMEPLLFEGKFMVKIEPITRKLKKGDLVLWWNQNETLILHRLVGENDKFYILRGDHNVYEECARKERVIGVASDIYLNGRWFPVTNRRYLAYVHRRIALTPVRKFAYRMRSVMKKKLSDSNFKERK